MRINEIAIQDKWRLETGKGKTNLPQDVYTQICELDPTTKNGNAGKYCDWLLRRVTPDMLRDNDKLRRLRIALEQFNDGKKRGILQRYGIPMDIGLYKTADDLISAISGVMSQGTALSQSATNKMEQLRGQYDIVGEDKDWIVVHPKTFEAERYFGSGTEWCTVGNEWYFKRYSERGPLYITFPKNGNDKLKMQFHFESKSFADYQDEVYDNPKACIANVLQDDKNRINPLFNLWSRISPDFNNYQYTFFDEVQGLLDSGERPEEVFDYVGDFNDGYAAVKVNGKWNFIDTKGKILSQQWFVWVSDFVEGYATVYLNGVKYLGTDGKLYDYDPRQQQSNVLTESKLRKIIRNVLLESGADDKYVDSTIASTFPQLQPYLNTPLAELRGIGLSVPDTDMQRYGNTRLKDYMRQSLMREFDISHGRGPAKYLRGIARVAIGELGWPDGNRGDLSKFKQYVLYIHNNEPEKFDKNLNALSFNELRDMFRQKTKDTQRLDVEKLGRENLGKSSYRVVPIRNVEEAMWYGNYTSWCITQRSYGESNYNSYTQGGGRFYFLLKEGFENVPKRVGENCPLDEYGLSMISVLVGMEGDIEIITTRWNHEHDGENNPNLHTAEQLQHITGIRVYEVLKPYTREELHKMGVVLFDEVQELLDSGKHPEEVFDWVGYFLEGYAKVRLNHKYNFIDKKNNILCQQWYDCVWDFSNGYAKVELNLKYNFIDTKGKIQFDQWFDYVDDFYKGYAAVELNGKWNFIDTKGKIQFKQWYDWVGDYFHEGYAAVKLNGKRNFIDTEGNILSDQWFDKVEDFSDGYARVELNGKRNFIDTEGKILSQQWFDYVDDFYEGYAIVMLNNKYNFIDTEGKILYPEPDPNKWFDAVLNFHNGYASVKLNGKWKYLGTDGRLYNDIPRRQSNVLTEAKLRKIIRKCLLEAYDTIYIQK